MTIAGLLGWHRGCSGHRLGRRAGATLSGRAPVGLVSLGVGMALGLALSKLAARRRRRRRPTAANHRRRSYSQFVTVVAEHTWLYRDFRRQWQEARAKRAAGGDVPAAKSRGRRPSTFAHELSPARVTLWCVDAALIVAAAVGAVIVSMRRQRQVDSAWPPTPNH